MKGKCRPASGAIGADSSESRLRVTGIQGFLIYPADSAAKTRVASDEGGASWREASWTIETLQSSFHLEAPICCSPVIHVIVSKSRPQAPN